MTTEPRQTKQNNILSMKYILIFLLIIGCSEEEINPKCQASADACKNYQRLMDQATSAPEKEKYYQLYLTEKHFLDYCLKSN